MPSTAPGIFNITAADTLTITGMFNGSLTTQVFNTLADKSTVHVEFPNDMVTVTIGKNGNAIFAANKKGSMADMDLRPLLGNVDDVFLTGQIAQWLNAPTAFVLLTGTFVKNLGDGQGNQKKVSYILNGGVVTKNPVLTENVEGDTDQAVAMYKVRWASAVRVID